MASSFVGGVAKTLQIFIFIGMGAGGSPAGAEPATVEVQLGARAGLDGATVAIAQQTASALLTASGINAAWRNCRVAASCEGSLFTVVLVQLLPVSKATDGDVCGETVRDMRSGLPTVLVYVPRLVALTHSMRSGARGRSSPALATLDQGHLIGLTVAHEVGHALGLSHASSGVMKARPSIDDVIAMRAANLRFGQSEAGRMRAAIAARAAQVAASAPDGQGVVDTSRVLLDAPPGGVHLLNHPMFASPANTIDAPNAARIASLQP